MRLLQLGVAGQDVSAWQLFLRGQGLYLGSIDGRFGKKSESATRAFQTSASLHADGRVGDNTYAAALAAGFALTQHPKGDARGAGWPARPPNLKPLGNWGRSRTFGKMMVVPAPTKSNPEAVKITNDWESKYLVSILIPQLAGVPGAPKNGRIFCHRMAAPIFRGFFQEIADNGLSDLILTYAGCWVPRYIRGSRTKLSNHAYGTALDLNAQWNGLGCRPALHDQRGSVRKLATVCPHWGLLWGGWYPTRPDGMHFEVVAPKIGLQRADERYGFKLPA